jgi:hypothetical protein
MDPGLITAGHRVFPWREGLTQADIAREIERPDRYTCASAGGKFVL